MIDIHSIHLTRDHKKVFSGLTLHIGKNEKRFIQGKSGKGKTTLLKLILGFDQPDAGTIRVNGDPVNPAHIRNIRSQIFYLSQDIDLPGGTPSEFIEQILSGTDQTWHNPINDLLPFFELDKKILDLDNADLSGGERQRMGLLIGCLLDRPIWLLDEPTSALDPAMKEKIAEKILQMKKTMLIVSHDNVWLKNNAVTVERW